MSEWPDVAILIPTYNRVQILIQTITLLEQNLRYSGVKRYFIGNDGDEVIKYLAEALPSSNLLSRISALVGPRRKYAKSNKFTGLGANLNMLIKHVKAFDLMFQLDDDHHLVQPLWLDPHVVELLDNDNIGWIRLMGVSHHHYTATLEGHYWQIHWGSEGPYSLYIPSNRPHLKHRRFHDYFGLYPEGMKLGETEEAFCHQCKRTWELWDNNIEHEADFVPPCVAVPLNSESETAWMHVGDSWQSKGE